jgi:hypothetical protein
MGKIWFTTAAQDGPSAGVNVTAKTSLPVDRHWIPNE